MSKHLHPPEPRDAALYYVSKPVFWAIALLLSAWWATRPLPLKRKRARSLEAQDSIDFDGITSNPTKGLCPPGYVREYAIATIHAIILALHAIEAYWLGTTLIRSLGAILVWGPSLRHAPTSLVGFYAGVVMLFSMISLSSLIVVVLSSVFQTKFLYDKISTLVNAQHLRVVDRSGPKALEPEGCNQGKQLD